MQLTQYTKSVRWGSQTTRRLTDLPGANREKEVRIILRYLRQQVAPTHPPRLHHCRLTSLTPTTARRRTDGQQGRWSWSAGLATHLQKGHILLHCANPTRVHKIY